jgi:hypothetical protein
MNNLFISYDLNSPGQDYTKIHDKIKSLGDWAKIQKSFWYVNSSYSAKQAKDVLLTVIDNNDSIIVVDTTNNSSSWYGVPDNVGQYIVDQWDK